MILKMAEKIDCALMGIDKCKVRQAILLAMDCIVCILSFAITMYLLDFKITTFSLLPMFIYAGINVGFLLYFRCYDSLWKCGGEKEVSNIFLACFCAAVTSRVLIVGAGVAGNMIMRELFENPELKKLPVAVIDDDRGKLGKYVFGVPVLGTTKDIDKIVKEENIDEIIICIANIEPKRKREIIDICKNTNTKLKTIPGIYEIIDGKVNVTKIRDVQIEDLLGRETVKMNLNDMDSIINDKVVMVTGGGGSIGSELCRQIAKYNPRQLIILDIYENNAYEIQQELIRHYHKNLDLKVLIASVRDEHKMEKIFEQYKPEIVFHAVAHKHVPLMEDSPCEAIKNNVFGTQNVVNLSDKYNVKKFVLISTDKAVNPTNIMGATKRCCEMIVQTKNKTSKTEFVAVRFGNVLGSNGSVVPLFKKQIEEGGPVTVTHEEVTRFFMTIPEAVSLVLQASAMAKGGEIFVLDMGEPVKIIDLARNLIKLSGFEPNVDIKIEVTGLRPGEKLYEEVLMDEEGLQKTSNNQIRIGRPIEIDEAEFKKELNILKRVADNDQDEKVDLIMKSIVPTYVRREEVVV